MSDFEEIDGTEEEEGLEEEQNAQDLLDNLNTFNDAVPTGAYVTLRHEVNPPVYVPLLGDEQSITLAAALERRGITVSTSIHTYFENTQIGFDHVLPAGAIVTLVGNVKGG